jgi:RNA polymerase sporulation-specific sigma factor
MKKIDDDLLIQLIQQAKDGDREAIARFLEECKSIVRKAINKTRIYVTGFSSDDLFQEGMLTIYEDMFDFDPTKGIPSLFFYMCVKKRLLALITKSANHKNSVLNSSCSLDSPMKEDGDTFYAMTSADDAYGTQSLIYQDPAKCLDVKESLHLARDFFQNKCTDKERKIYELSVEGFSYQQIAEKLQLRNKKTVDNTIQRVRKKLGNCDFENYQPESIENPVKEKKKSMKKFDNDLLSEWIPKAKNRDRFAMKAILDMATPFVEGFIRKKGYYAKGSEFEDLVQEGLIAVTKAVEQYDSDKGVVPSSFMAMVIERALASALIAANRKKHQVLSDSASLDKPAAEDSNYNHSLVDTITYEIETYDPYSLMYDDPASSLEMQEILEQAQDYLNYHCSKTEKQIFDLHLHACSYTEIGEQLNVTNKAIDNAIQRVKRKLRDFKPYDVPDTPPTKIQKSEEKSMRLMKEDTFRLMELLLLPKEQRSQRLDDLREQFGADLLKRNRSNLKTLGYVEGSGDYCECDLTDKGRERYEANKHRFSSILSSVSSNTIEESFENVKHALNKTGEKLGEVATEISGKMSQAVSQIADYVSTPSQVEKVEIVEKTEPDKVVEIPMNNSTDQLMLLLRQNFEEKDREIAALKEQVESLQSTLREVKSVFEKINIAI